MTSDAAGEDAGHHRMSVRPDPAGGPSGWPGRRPARGGVAGRRGGGRRGPRRPSAEPTSGASRPRPADGQSRQPGEDVDDDGDDEQQQAQFDQDGAVQSWSALHVLVAITLGIVSPGAKGERLDRGPCCR